MRRAPVVVRVIGVIVGGIVLVSLPANAHAAPPNITVSTTVNANCVTFVGPIQLRPFNGNFSVNLVVPKLAHRRDQITAHLSVGFPVSTSAQVGIAELSGGPAVTPLGQTLNGLGVIGADPGATTITGDITFNVTGEGTAQWRLGPFGQLSSLGGTLAQEVCTPTTNDVLAETRIAGKGQPAT